MRRFSTSIALAVFALLLVSTCSAQQTPTAAVPNLIRYGGTLKNADGAPVAVSTGVTFAIYKQQDGGAPIWIETQNVTPDASGQYSVILGSTTATGLPADLFSQEEQRWLGVQIQGEAEWPRVLLVSVPYAFKAYEAETLAGKRVSDFVLAKGADAKQAEDGAVSSSQAGTTNNGKTQPTTAGHVAAASAGPTNFSGATTDQIVGVTQTGTGSGINASTSSASTSNAVVGTISGPGVAIFGQAHSTSAQAYGVQGNSASTIGIGLLGFATATTGSTYGLKGYASSTGGTGVRGLSTATTGYTTGISASVASPAGTAGVFNNVAGGKILSGQNNGVERFSVDGGGNVNSASGTYRINSQSVLGIGGPSDGNLFLGVLAGASNVAGQGKLNVFSGAYAGYSSNSILNTFIGAGAGYLNTTGAANTFIGAAAGFVNTTGSENTFIGGGAAESNTTGAYNTFTGESAGHYNTTGDGNTFTGYESGYSNTTASNNTLSGYQAGYSNTTGDGNTFTGYESGYSNTTASSNTLSGYQAGYSNTTGFGNTFSGIYSGYYNTTGYENTFYGTAAGFNNGGNNNNTFIGASAGFSFGSNNTLVGALAGGNSNFGGAYNTFYGYNSGSNYESGDNNIYIGSPGVNQDYNTIRIGGDVGYGGPQTAVFIAGIYGATASGGSAVYINSSGQLGTLTSSQRFKEQIADMGDSTNGLLKLRPVTFLYKPEYDKGERTPQYGLIAEEVAKIYPELVAYDPDGQPYTVKYQYLAPMLLNELQKEHTVIVAQQEQISEMQERLARLEALIGK